MLRLNIHHALLITDISWNYQISKTGCTTSLERPDQNNHTKITSKTRYEKKESETRFQSTGQSLLRVSPSFPKFDLPSRVEKTDSTSQYKRLPPLFLRSSS